MSALVALATFLSPPPNDGHPSPAASTLGRRGVTVSWLVLRTMEAGSGLVLGSTMGISTGEEGGIGRAALGINLDLPRMKATLSPKLSSSSQFSCSGGWMLDGENTGLWEDDLDL